MNPVILIPARLASTRLPEKPLADIHGEPMIVHVWRRAAASCVGTVVVACDDVRIKEAVEKAGGQAVMTNPDHPSGSDRIFEALGLIDPHKHYDIIVNVQGDIPTVEPEVIRSVLKPLENPDVDIATLACEIIRDEERTDAAVVKPVLVFHSDPNIARALYFSRATVPHGEGALYHHIGIYAYRRAALERFISLAPSPLELREKLEQLRALENNMRIDAMIVNTMPLGVDTPEHLERARKLMR